MNRPCTSQPPSLQQQRGDGGVDSAGQADDDACVGGGWGERERGHALILAHCAQIRGWGSRSGPRGAPGAPQRARAVTALFGGGSAPRRNAGALSRSSCGHRLQCLAAPGEVVAYAAQDERTAQPCALVLEILRGQPMGADDAAVERLRGIVVTHRAGKSEAQDRAAAGRVAPQVHAHQASRLKAPGGLFARLAHHRCEQGLAALDVAGRLIEQQRGVRCAPRREGSARPSR